MSGRQDLSEKLVQIDSDLHEHEVVVATLRNLPENRRCWRMVDSCLVEMSCKDAVAALSSAITGMKKSTKRMSDEVGKKREEFTQWKQKNNVRIVRAE
ncbi:hypothetical protein HII13_003827 [Brettanomyces bruxellensis]|nr:hypothetical protein HII13_003827 [Brettanomyces bruxellensis]